MGSRVNVCDVKVLNNPCNFTDEFQLEITFEVFENLPHDLEWELVYVGSADTSENDQVLDSALVGPVPAGRHKFVLSTPAPNTEKIPAQDIVGVTVILLKCSYNEQLFFSLGYYVANEYETPEMQETPPSKPQIDKLTRTVRTEDPKVVAYPIKWDDNQTEEIPQVDEEIDEADLMPLEDEPEVEDQEEEDDDEKEVSGDIELEDEPEESEETEKADKDTPEPTEAANKDSAPNGDEVEEGEAMETGENVVANTAAAGDGKIDETKDESPPLGDKTNDVASV